jgi:hypothetical protein
MVINNAPYIYPYLKGPIRVSQEKNGDQILICSKTYDVVKDHFKVEQIDHINRRGIEGERSIYNVIDVI